MSTNTDSIINSSADIISTSSSLLNITNSYTKFRVLGLEILFPFEPYGIQKSMLSTLTKSFKSKQHVLMESPTGTGKTLVLLSASLAWQAKSKLLGKPFTKDLMLADCATSTPKQSFSVVSNDLETKRQRLEMHASQLPILENSSPELAQISANQIEGQDLNDSGLGPEDIELATSNHQLAFETELGGSADIQDKMLDPIPCIYYGTRTHSQISQVVGELKQTPFNYADLRMCILSGRERSCINETIANLPNRDDKCLELISNAREQYISMTSNSSFRHLNSPKCKYYTNQRSISSVYRGICASLNKSRIWDIEDAVDFGKRNNCCPYYGIRSQQEKADITFAPYNYLLDPTIRESLNINLQNAIVILDEAHNIEDICRISASSSIDTKQIKTLLDYMDRLLTVHTANSDISASLKYFKRMLLSLNSFLNSLLMDYLKPDKSSTRDSLEKSVKSFAHDDMLRFLVRSNLGPHEMVRFRANLLILKNLYNSQQTNVHQQHQGTEKRQKGLVRVQRSSSKKFNSLASSSRINRTDNSNESSPNLIRLLNKLKISLDFIYKPNTNNIKDFNMIITRTVDSECELNHGLFAVGVIGCKFTIEMKLLCMNPALAFQSIRDEAWSVVVASGTLAPIQSLKHELGCQFSTVFEGAHVIKGERVFARVLSCGPNNVNLDCSYMNSKNLYFQDEVGLIIKDICEIIPNGILCFFPSYERMNVFKVRWLKRGILTQIQNSGKVLFVERRGSSPEESERQVSEYISSANKAKGALLFAVYRGNISEGINFADNAARGVLTIGIPYPNISDTGVQLKKSYNDLRRSQGEPQIVSGDDWYASQAFRVLNQAAGRCIRHKQDWGAVIMIDSRLNSDLNLSNITKWLRFLLMRTCFYNDMCQALRVFVDGKRCAQEVRVAEDQIISLD